MDFEVLGFKLKLKPSVDGRSDPREVLDLVREEADRISSRSPSLDRGEVAILVALKMACDRLDIEREYRDNIESFSATAKDALRCIEGVSQTTV